MTEPTGKFIRDMLESANEQIAGMVKPTAPFATCKCCGNAVVPCSLHGNPLLCEDCLTTETLQSKGLNAKGKVKEAFWPDREGEWQECDQEHIDFINATVLT